LASTPIVGFQLTPHFALAEIFRAWSPILDKMVDEFRNPTFTFNNDQGSVLSFTTKDGFVYAVDHMKASVSFMHRLQAKAVSGGPPVMEMLSKPLPYTELLAQVSERLIEAARLLPNISDRKIFQVGVVSTTRVDIKDVPPGIERFIDYLKRPWGGKEISWFNVQMINDVNETESWTDRCQHQLNRPEKLEDLLTLSFDFHRKFKVGQASSEAHMRTLLNKCIEDGLAYFEKLAEGNMFDEHIIGDKTN
jgi:hypothetical protein